MSPPPYFYITHLICLYKLPHLVFKISSSLRKNKNIKMSSHAKRLTIFIVLILAITSTDVSDATLRHVMMNLRSNTGIKEGNEIKERELVEFHLDYARTGANQDHEPGKGRP
ncbi:hypothetical protein HA466_0019040 [Hirschfeldia incana]|nr:hypothetical protein HA466_0019040 [Hirschfeldia incana]